MMFSMEKCLGRSGTGNAEEAELFAGGGEGLGKEGVPSDEVASAVAAVSDEIGDILKDELGDADRAERIGAELADLSAELGLLAGLADGEPQQDFPSLFEIAMGHRGSGSGSSSSSWSGGRGGRPRRHSRPQRAPRRRPIAKGKEMSRRRSAAARRAVCMRVRRVEVVSDASDVGAESDSDDQWTELDDASGSSDSSSLKEAAAVDVDCNGFQHKAEAPAMGQFLLPLLSSDAPAPDPEHFLIRHEDILQLLASAEEIVHDDIPLEDDSPQEPQTDMLSGSEMLDDDAAVTAEEEAALLHYVCGMELKSLKLEDPGIEGIPGIEPIVPLKRHTPEELEDAEVEELRNRLTAQKNRIGDKKPNLQAIQDYKAKEELYLRRAAELDEITTRRNEMRALYDELRKKRTTDFLRGFNTITAKLKEMYQMITLGGDAELELVDSLDPFTEGIVFSVRPPNKSWKNISNLSGGEKTLSSLALVFALHYYKPTPLYVMDEIDAALDFKNVSIVANYIKERTKNAQFIIISLRYNMFEVSNRLVGIYKTEDCTKSVTIENKIPDPLPNDIAV